MNKVKLGTFADIVTVISFLLLLFSDLTCILKIFIFLTVLFWLLSRILGKNSVKNRDKTISIGKNVIRNTKNLVVLFGGDLSWTEDYKTELKKLIENGKTVEIVYPDSKLINNSQMENRLVLLKNINAKLFYTENDIGLRCIISDPFLENKNDFVLYIADRIKSNSEEFKYSTSVYRFSTDEVICNAFYKFYELSKSIRKLRK
jgi:hypothetical protein